MHLAAAVGAKGVALFGPTSPLRNGPFGGNFTVITALMNCLGCRKRRCPGSPCMAAIGPELVHTKALLLAQPGLMSEKEYHQM